MKTNHITNTLLTLFILLLIVNFILSLIGSEQRKTLIKMNQKQLENQELLLKK